MRFARPLRDLDLTLPSERVRHMHERWLTLALAIGDEVFPHIPIRRVDRGGFQGMLSSPGGAERAAQWWFDAFARLDSLDQD